VSLSRWAAHYLSEEPRASVISPCERCQPERELSGKRAEAWVGVALVRWSGWGSPVGLSILLSASGFFLVCLHWAGFIN
ncbi:MAG: hypothetical protein KC561_13420, partial [Myxococcales bacterium]|nr:hypothetical protein [Myxococcales bacterium]